MIKIYRSEVVPTGFLFLSVQYILNNLKYHPIFTSVVFVTVQKSKFKLKSTNIVLIFACFPIDIDREK